MSLFSGGGFTLAFLVESEKKIENEWGKTNHKKFILLRRYNSRILFLRPTYSGHDVREEHMLSLLCVCRSRIQIAILVKSNDFY